MANSEMRIKLNQWLSDGQAWVGVFENHDLGSPDVGRRVAMAFDIAQFDVATLGMRAPDTRTLIGWRYGLVAKCKTVEEALTEMREV